LLQERIAEDTFGKTVSAYIYDARGQILTNISTKKIRQVEHVQEMMQYHYHLSSGDINE
jgi:hypothetical protein